MKLTRIFTILFAFCTIFTQAQVVEKTEEKAKQKSEQRLDQKIDNGIDSGLDAIEGLFSKKKKKKETVEEEEVNTEYTASENSSNDAEAAAMTKMMGDSKVQIQDEYQFDHLFVILMEDFNKKGKPGESNEMTFLSKEESSIMGMLMNQEGINTTVIYDLASYEILTLMDVSGQKMGTTMSIDKSLVEGMTSEGDSEEANTSKMPTFKKTGETKTISGYSCDEYVVDNLENSEETKMAYWITDEAEIDWIKSMANMSGINKQMPNMYAGTGYPEDGSVIQMIVEEKNGERMVMTVLESETKDTVVSTKGYNFMNVGGR